MCSVPLRVVALKLACLGYSSSQVTTLFAHAVCRGPCNLCSTRLLFKSRAKKLGPCGTPGEVLVPSTRRQRCDHLKLLKVSCFHVDKHCAIPHDLRGFCVVHVDATLHRGKRCTPTWLASLAYVPPSYYNTLWTSSVHYKRPLSSSQSSGRAPRSTFVPQQNCALFRISSKCISKSRNSITRVYEA